MKEDWFEVKPREMVGLRYGSEGAKGTRWIVLYTIKLLSAVYHVRSVEKSRKLFVDI